MFQSRLYISGVLGVLFLMGMQNIDAAETQSSTTTTSSKTADGVTVTETKESVQGQPPGRIAQLKDGVLTRINSGYESVNKITGGRLDTVKNGAVNGYNTVLTRVNSMRNKPPAGTPTDTKSECILPPQTQTVVTTTKQNTEP